MITSNGARVHDSDGQQIFAHNLDRDIAADLFEIVRNDPKIVTNVYREDEWYMNRHRPEEMRFFKEAVFNYKLYEPGELDPQGISKVFFTCEDHEHLLPLEQAMNARWGDRVNVSFSTLTCPRKLWRVGYRRGMRWRRWRRCSATLFPIASPSATV